MLFTGNQSSVTQYQHLFFQSRQLSAGEHTLTITNMVSGGQFFLDFINVTVPNTTTAGKLNTKTSISLSSTKHLTKATEIASASSKTSAHTSASLSTSTSASSSIASPMSSTGIFPAAGRSAGKKLPVAMIVLGVFLGILFVVLVTIGIIILKKKQKGRRKGIDRFPLDCK